MVAFPCDLTRVGVELDEGEGSEVAIELAPGRDERSAVEQPRQVASLEVPGEVFLQLIHAVG